MKSMLPASRFSRGESMPGIRRTGRMLAYCWNSRRILMSRPQSETWSGTDRGRPTAPRNMASWPLICSSPSSGIMRPCLR